MTDSKNIRDKLIAEFSDETVEDRAIVNMVEGLKATEGWQHIVQMLEEQLRLRRDIYELNNNDGMDGLVNREFLRGEIATLRLVLEYPEKLLENAQAGLEAWSSQLKAQLKELDDAPEEP